MDMEKQSITMKELKKQVEALGLEEKQKTKFLIEEWKKLCKCEEKRLEVEREEKRLEVKREHELELRRIEAEKAAMELEQARIEFESKNGGRENRSDGAEEIRRKVKLPDRQSYEPSLMGKMIWIIISCVLRDMLQLHVGRSIHGLRS